MDTTIVSPSQRATAAPRHRIAVIGSGAAGLAAAWSLAKRHDVHLFEAESRLGGHAHTVEIDVDGAATAVDTGFIVFNDVNYPSLTAMFETLGVATQASDMSFSVSAEGGRFEYAGRWPGGILAQKGNLLSPGYWAMLGDIRRFYGRAVADLAEVERRGITLGAYVAECRFSNTFRDRHLLPMVAAIWSLPTTGACNMPAAAVIRFFQAHGLLRLRNRPQWRTVTGGSRSYVDAIADDFSGTLHTGRPVRAVIREAGGVRLALPGQVTAPFDHVVVAAHGDQALSLLANPTAEESRILGAFRYSANHVLLHSDVRLMPRRRGAWASWNFLQAEDGRQGVSYWMNLLQNLATPKPVLVTLNPPVEPKAELVYRSFSYDHPIFDQQALAMQPRLDGLQGGDRVWFCGSYFGYGFHEDAFASGLRAAAALSANLAGDTGGAAQIDAVSGHA